MSDVDLEEALASTLKRHAGRAPEPHADLPGRVEAGLRRRRITRTRTGVTAAALAVAMVIVGGQMLRPDEKPPPTIEPVPVTVTPTSRPIEKQWPRAIERIPRTLPDGTRFTPEVHLDERTLLIATWRSPGVASALYTYDVPTGRTVRLGFPAQPAGVESTLGFTPGAGRIGWVTRTKRTAEIWTVPLSGGPATRLYSMATGRSEEIYPLALTEGSAFWSVTKGGIFQAPLRGGPATRLPGTDGLWLLSWPWAGGPRYSDGGSALADDAPQQQIVNRNLLNLATGERRSVTGTGLKGRWACSATWCASAGEIRSRDGRRAVRPAPGQDFPELGQRPVGDRFVLMTPAATMSDTYKVTLVDLETGKGGTYGSSRGKNGGFHHSPEDGRVLYIEEKESYVLIDLAKIS
ncbi:hypothetical protein [Spirillospora sp. NPDC047279]|uniref:hypothetical protein n=1 Tax=Spirillospora sp. NPDC047279 TaxID=3155478 RepID=UPI0033F82CE2